MKNKFYTPKADEFHQGFEFEANYTKEGWQKEIFGVGSKSIDSIPQLCVHFLQGKPFKEHIRVKYLDQEDFENLGYIFKEDAFVSKIYNSEKGKFYYRIKQFDSNIININKIFTNQDIGIEPIISAIKIKNKSEFLRLKKQLEIK